MRKEEDKELEVNKQPAKEEPAEEKAKDEIEEMLAEEEAPEEIVEQKPAVEEKAEAPAEEKEEKEKAEAGEAEKKGKEEKKPEEEEIVEERIYTVPLGKAWIMPPRRRAPRAIRILRAFVIKHMKLEARKETEEEEEEEPARLIIDNEVNLRMWSRGIEKPPRKIRVRAAKDKEGNVTIYLAEGD